MPDNFKIVRGWRTRDALHMPRVFNTEAVYRAWLGVLAAQYQSGHISDGKYRARRKQARDQWEHELRCCPDRLSQPYFGRHGQEENPTV
jgi:hypothetical protein